MSRVCLSTTISLTIHEARSLFYYILIPFYLAAGMDPVGSLGFSLIVGLAAITSIYWVFNRLYSRPAGSLASLIYAVSFSISSGEREVVPTTPVFLWSVWFFYALNRLFSGHKSSLLILAVLFSLVWHLHLALVLLIPLVFVAVWLNRSLYRPRDFLVPLAVFISLSVPLLIFELRHNFQQTTALLTSLASIGTKSGSLWQKISHVILYASRNSTGLFVPFRPPILPVYIIPALCLLVMVFLSLKKTLPRYTLLLYALWIILFLLFFAAHPINLSEYYLNGLNILWLAAAVLFLTYIYRRPAGRILVTAALAGFVAYHLGLFLTSPINRSGYLERTAVVNAISADARAHDYPCVSVSYMTNPGYELGYRYLFWRARLHVNQPKSQSPVYTVVFPHTRADRLDWTFGALGLILPDYAKYSPDSIRQSCSGANANLTDPMFGFTK